MSELSPEFQPLARGMIEEHIVKFGEFTLRNGKHSVAYVNLRDMISIPRLFDLAVSAYACTLDNSGLLKREDGTSRSLLAIPEAATYYGGAVARELKVPLLYHRVKPKEHGQPRSIEGRYKQGDEVVLLDDVVTDAGAKLDEYQMLAEAGLNVTGVVVLVDREQGGRSELNKNGLDFAAAMTLSGIAKYALEEGLSGVNGDVYASLLSELDSNEVQL